MKASLCILLLSMCFMVTRVQGQEALSITEAETAALQWLELTDAGGGGRRAADGDGANSAA